MIQRVGSAHVSVNEKYIAKINKGFLILVGIEDDDNEEDIDWITKKTVALRIFDDEQGKMNLNIQQVDGHVLLVSQFTLHASCKKGNRPSFIRAARPEIANALFNALVSKFIEAIGIEKVQTGQFGAMMNVGLENDGPVTILLDTKNKE